MMRLGIGTETFGLRSLYCEVIDPGTAILASGAIGGLSKLFGGGGGGGGLAPIQQINRQENTQATNVSLTNIVGGQTGQAWDWALSSYNSGRDLYRQTKTNVTDAFATMTGYPFNGQARAIPAAVRSPGPSAPSSGPAQSRPPWLLPVGLAVAVGVGFVLVEKMK
jgi:hypothetical protein